MIYEVKEPLSLNAPQFAEYEYLIRWFGKDGSDYLWMFYDAEISQKVTGTIINEQSTNNISALNSSESKIITLIAEDITLAELNIIGEMFTCPYVYRQKKNGYQLIIERLAPVQNSLKYRLRDKKFNIEFELQYPNLKIFK